MSDELGTSRRYLEQQYGDDANLAARQSIYVYQRPRLDLYNGSLDLAAMRGDESVLDVGCGNGRYLEALQTRGHRGLVCGADLSVGMVRKARLVSGDDPLLVSDARALPFATDSFDIVLAMHMLYHVPDRAVAIAELRRVLRPSGVALVLTNSERHFRELDELLIASADETVGRSRVRSRASLTLFSVEAAPPELETAFSDVTLHTFASELVIDDVEPLLAYARSMGTFVADGDHELEPVLVEFERRVRAIIQEHGAFRIGSASGCFVCR
jgi:ubiquinone/menaquinone biosynthesis C-methylase UbiE